MIENSMFGKYVWIKDEILLRESLRKKIAEIKNGKI